MTVDVQNVINAAAHLRANGLSPNAQHSLKSSEWYTPGYVLDATKEVLGKIDLDPFSSEKANQEVGASWYYDQEADGLSAMWANPYTLEPVTIFINPPGGKRNNVSMPRLAWEKLQRALAEGTVKHAIWIAYSIEQLQQLQKPAETSIGKYPMCIIDHRLRFIQDGKPMSSPTHGNAVVYIPGTLDESVNFEYTFSQLGQVYLPGKRRD